jgi:hypothetical protein
MTPTLPILLALVLRQATVPPAPDQEAVYFPTEVGATWLYEEDIGGTKREKRYQVVSVDKQSDGLVISVATAKPGGVTALRDRWLVSNKGLTRLQIAGIKLDSPVCVLRLPHKAGENWKVRISGSEQLTRDAHGNQIVGSITRETGNVTQVAVEEVVVPAGKYRAIRVEMITSPAGGKESRRTSWFAPGVGEVKLTVDGSDFRVLKSFTPGKTKP